MNGHYEIGEVVLDNWRLVEIIGKGGYGKVYEAHREEHNYTYKSAIKIITIPKDEDEIANARYEGMDDASMTAYFQSFVDKIIRECELMSQLQSSENIVSYADHRIIQHDDKIGWDILIRMELLTPLKKVDLQNMSQHEVIRLGIDICKALELCGRKNIIHRDIKPENIFISELGNYKLGDFGIARTIEETTGATKTGTFPYMAPEVRKEEPYNATVDIYSLGIVLYSLLNKGRIPFLPLPPQQFTFSDREEAIERRMRGERIPPPVNAGSQLASVVLRACAYDPRERYAQPALMRAELETLLLEEDQRGRPAPPVTIPPVVKAPIMTNAASDEIADETMSAIGGSRERSGGGTYGEEGQGIKIEEDRVPDDAEESPDIDQTSGFFGNRPKRKPEPQPEPAPEPQPDLQPEPEPESREKDGFAKGARAFLEKLKALSRKAKIGIAAAAAFLVLLVVILAIRGGSGGAGTGPAGPASAGSSVNQLPQSGTNPGEEPNPAEDSVLVWSDWLDALPDTVDAENSAIEAKLQYRSTPLIRVEYGEEKPEGATLLESKYGDYGEWSGWQSEYIESSEVTEVETTSSSVYVPATNWSQRRPSGSNIESRQISYNNRTSTVTEYRRKAGYTNVTQYRSRTRQIIEYYYQNNAWSNYSDAPIASSESTLVNYRMQYRYTDIADNQPVTPSMSNFPIFDENYSSRFRDVSDDAWYGPNNSNILRTVSELGILLPDGYMRFNPNRNITIGQVIRAAVMIQRIYNGYAGLLGENNGDYQIYADYAIENGMIRQGEFSDLTKEATRQEMAYIFYNALPEEELVGKKQIDAITDMDMGYRYYDCALAMAEAGIINLNQNNEYRPEDTATRAEAASIIDAMAYPEHRSGGQ